MECRGIILLVLLDRMVVKMCSGVVSIWTGKEMYCGDCWGSVKLWWWSVVDMERLELSRARFGWVCGGDILRRRESV